MQGVVQHPAEIGRRPAERDAQIGTADVADEQRVAGQHAVRHGSRSRRGRRRRARSTRRCGPASRAQRCAPCRTRRRRRRRPARTAYSALADCAEVDRRAETVAKLEMAGDEVRVEVRQEDVLDLEAVLAGEREIPIDVALRIDDGRHTRLLVTDEVRRVGETAEVELLKNHKVRRGRAGARR